MVTYEIRHLPVVNDAGSLVGLITERLLYKIHSPRKLEDGSFYYDDQMLDGFILKNVMFKEPFTLKPQNTLRDAVEYMTRSKFGCVVIVDDYRIPCGIVTRNDILKFLLTQ
jgi:CBS domain-containing protein